jgi:hypothetical protein
MTFSASTLNGGIVCQASDCVIERGVRNNYAKLLVARLTNRMQFDLKINRELDPLRGVLRPKPAESLTEDSSRC